MEVRLAVGRFFCGNETCPKITFAGQVDGLTAPWSRRTLQLRSSLDAIGLALAGRAGARLAQRLGMRTGYSSLLRLIRALPEPEVTTVSILGVDDFAFRRGRTYGTILIDMGTRRPIDLLDGRDAEPLRSWLEAHPGTEFICRDRSNPYADAAKAATPDSVQVADRFHLWQKLAGAVEECLMHHRDALAEPLPISGAVPLGEEGHRTKPRISQGRMATRARAHHRIVHDLIREGLGLREITRKLGWSRNTVRRYANAQRWQDMVTPRRPSKLDPFKTYLHLQWQAGRGNVTDLHAEIQSMGYTGSYANTAAYLARFRSRPAGPPATITTPHHRPAKSPAGRPATPQTSTRSPTCDSKPCSHEAIRWRRPMRWSRTSPAS